MVLCRLVFNKLTMLNATARVPRACLAQVADLVQPSNNLPVLN